MCILFFTLHGPFSGTWSSTRRQLCPQSGAAGGADPCQALCVYHWDGWYWKEQDLTFTEQDLPELKEKTCVAGLEPQGGDQR